MSHIVFNFAYFVSGLGAIIYGYSRWREYDDKTELQWCFLGIFMVLVILWHDVTWYVLPSSMDQNLLYWSRQILNIFLLVAACKVYFSSR